MSVVRVIALVGITLVLSLSAMLVALPSASAASAKPEWKVNYSFHCVSTDPSICEFGSSQTYTITYFDDGTFSGVGQLNVHVWGPTVGTPPWGFVFFHVLNNGTWALSADDTFLIVTETDRVTGNGFAVIGCDVDYLHGPPCSVYFVNDPALDTGVVATAGQSSFHVAPGFFVNTEVIEFQ